MKEFPATVCNPSDDRPEVEDIRDTLQDILKRIWVCKTISDYEKKELLTFNFNFNIMAKDLKLEKSPVGMLVMGSGHTIQYNHIEQTNQSDSVNFKVLKHELERLANDIQNNHVSDIITHELLDQLRQAVEEKNESLLTQYVKKVPIAFLKFAKDIGANFY